MKVYFGAHVQTSDGKELGLLRELVVHPDSRAVTHLVVQNGLLTGSAIVIPAGSVRDADPRALTLVLTAAQVEECNRRYVDRDFEAAEAPATVKPASPTTRLPELPASVIPPGIGSLEPAPAVAVDLDESVLEAGSKVETADGCALGTIGDVIMDQVGRIHSIRVKGSMFREGRDIPVQWITAIEDNRVVIAPTRNDLG